MMTTLHYTTLQLSESSVREKGLAHGGRVGGSFQENRQKNWGCLIMSIFFIHKERAWDKLCTAGALRAHVSKTTQRRWREETSSNTCGCSNTTEQSDSLMLEIHIENAYGILLV